MAWVITKFDDLLAALDAFPPPAPGFVRVYRGQNQDFPTMTPTALRQGPHARDMLWPLYASAVARDILSELGGDSAEVGDDLSLLLLWVEAIKQHYGPGTSYLDVTHSPGVAAWFALHRAEQVPCEGVYGPPGPFDPTTDVVARHDLWRFVPEQDRPGFLYALDVRPAAQPLDLVHGTLFDLADAPRVFAGSPRIQAQRACLVLASEDEADGDLKPFCVAGTPLEIGWPLAGCPEVQLPADQIFPPVAEDHWYNRFVSLPLTPNLDPEGPATEFTQAIPISLYLPQTGRPEADREGLDALTGRIVCLPPPLFFHDLVSGGSADLTARIEGAGNLLRAATPMLLEGPLLHLLPPVEHEMFNLGMLAHDLADAAPVLDAPAGRVTGEASLKNVFLELSPLEETGWERVERGGRPLEICRGIWLLREDHRFMCTVFLHEIGSGRQGVVGPAKIVYDPDGDDYLVAGGDPDRPTRLRDLPLLPGHFLKALALVRMLSPGWKISHAAQLMTGLGDGTTSIVRIEWAIADLVGLSAYHGPIARYHALRQWNRSEPFFGDAPSDSAALRGALEISGEPYGTVAPGPLRAKFAEALAGLPAGGPKRA